MPGRHPQGVGRARYEGIAVPHTICDTWCRVTKEETRARDMLRSTIRLCYLSRPPYGDETIRIASDEFKEMVT